MPKVVLNAREKKAARRLAHASRFLFAPAHGHAAELSPAESVAVEMIPMLVSRHTRPAVDAAFAFMPMSESKIYFDYASPLATPAAVDA